MAAIDVFDFKWKKYAYKLHYFGAAMHLVYVMTLAVYVYFTYLVGKYGEKPSFVFPILMICGLIYPFCYDAAQLYKSGWEYFDDPWNWNDFLFQWAGVINISF